MAQRIMIEGREETVLSVREMREADAFTIETAVDGCTLMGRAAKGVFDAVKWESPVAILAGGGNNGGDGYAIACLLADAGIVAAVYAVSEKLTKDGAHYRASAAQKGVKIMPFSADAALSRYPMIVDCILGTGFSGELRQSAADAIQAVNREKERGAFVVSVDINSGMNGDSGEAKLAVRSSLTVSIGYYKPGLLADAAKPYIGRLVNVPIGILLPE